MKQHSLFVLVLVALAPLLSHCVATDTDVHNIDLRMRTLDNRMVEIENFMQQNRRGGGRAVDDMQKRQADTADQLDRINAEILKLKGQMEESSHRYRLAGGGAGSADLMQDLQNKMETMKADVEQLKADVAAMKDQEFRDAADDASRAAEEARKKATQTPPAAPTESKTPAKTEAEKKVTETPAKEQPKAAATTPEKKDQGGRDLYEKGIALYKKNSYGEAQTAFSEYLSKHPGGDMAPNARFWLGDCHFAENNYEYAILEYDRVVKDYGNHEKAPAALLKQGMAFEKLKDEKTAKIIYDKLIKNYPKSEQVEKAKGRLDALKK